MGLSTVEAFKHLNAPGAAALTDAQRARLHGILLEALCDIAAVCRDHGLFWCLGGGTALGAVRHSGFIPWDDDADVNMPRADYEHFIPLFTARFGGKYWVHTPRTAPGLGLLMARIRRRGTVLKTREDFANDECGAFVDVFILENTFDHALLCAVHGAGCMALGLALSCRRFWRDRRFLLPLAQGDRRLARVFRLKAALGALLAWGSVGFWTRLADGWNALCKNGGSRRVAIPAGRRHFWGELYPRGALCACTIFPFEGQPLPVPAGYRRYLGALYGGWEQLPPENAREHHLFFAADL